MGNLKTNTMISFLILLFLQHVASYTPQDNFAINCGSTISQTSPDNRNWTADTTPLSITLQRYHRHHHHPSLIPYTTSLFSRSQFSYSFPVTQGPKLLRLYFYPTSYPGFPRHHSLFSVTANHHTLLNHFNASLHADNHAYPSPTFTTQYYINVEPNHPLNITFSPSSTIYPKPYAFINGIEVVSIPNHLYEALVNGTLKTVHRINLGVNENHLGSTSKSSQPPTPPTPKTGKRNNIEIPIIVSVVTASLLVLSFIGFIIFRCARRNAIARDGNGDPSSTRCREFSLAEIRAATNDFDEGLIVGKGGFGNVYEGNLQTCEKRVAIKRLKPGSEQGEQEFETEIKMLSRFRHPNLVSLIGFCNDGGEMILVYDFMARGTLRDHLYGSSSGGLSWERRLKVCVEAARGLQFLHAGVEKQSVIHRDVKSTNILLDEDWVAKVSDFGLSKVGPYASHVTTDVKGSFGYLDPEYYMSLWLTHKSDVYSFGVVLLEVLCGRAPIQTTAEKHRAFLVAWVRRCHHDGNVHQTVDPALKGTIGPKCLNKFVGIALSCLNDHGKERPLMKDVVKGLEYVLDLQRRASLKGKTLQLQIDLTQIHYANMNDEVGEVMNASSTSKATTTCSEEERALVHEVFQTARRINPRLSIVVPNLWLKLKVGATKIP